jgi:hypothetical protein
MPTEKSQGKRTDLVILLVTDDETQCDIKEPQCSNCEIYGYPCTYRSGSDKRKYVMPCKRPWDANGLLYMNFRTFL